MSIPETLLAAVCLLVTCSGIAVMAEDWRDTASANRGMGPLPPRGSR